MSYIVEQKIKNNIYLYRVESYWDKEKKQARQKRTYIGPKHRKKRQSSALKTDSSNIIHKKFGNIFLLNHISQSLGLDRLLQEIFPALWEDILHLAYYFVCDERASYLYTFWLDEQYAPSARRLYSADLYSVYQQLGENQQAVVEFFEKWILLCSPDSGMYFDITSISSYSTNIDFVEWGYNRDHENLPQVNLGIICTNPGEMPLCYKIYPGSIWDVSTLNNCLKRLHGFGVHDVVLVLDKGFCSKANILRLNELKEKITFIQPMTFSLKLVKQLIMRHRRNVRKLTNAFKFKEEVLYHQEASVNLDECLFKVHIYYNEKAWIDQRHGLLARLLDIEKEISKESIKTRKDYLAFRTANIPDKLIKFFGLNTKTMTIERNTRAIAQHLTKAGYFLLLSNSNLQDRDNVLNYYRSRDRVEKMFDVEKNELDGKRIQAHSSYNADGRIFVKFIALILHSEIRNTMKVTKLIETYSVRELLAVLSKIRRSKIGEETMIGEISKTQKQILKGFKITPELVTNPSY